MKKANQKYYGTPSICLSLTLDEGEHIYKQFKCNQRQKMTLKGMGSPPQLGVKSNAFHNSCTYLVHKVKLATKKVQHEQHGEKANYVI
jgi:hypothetical protein